MLKIKTVINGVEHSLPDSILEKMDKKLKKIKNYVFAKFKPITDKYPNADIFIQWKEENGKADITYVSTSLSTEEMNIILNEDQNDRFGSALS